MYKGIILLACLVGLAQCRMKEWTIEEYPDPQKDPVKCGRSNRVSYVCDPNGLMTSAEADVLDHILLNFPNDTKCPCSQYDCDNSDKKRGFIMAVALVKKIKAAPGSPDNLEARKVITRKFALSLLRKHWAYGKHCDEATVIVFSQEDGVLATHPGTAAARYLTVDVVNRMEREMARFFRDGSIGQGLHYLVLNYRRVLDGEYYNHVMFTDIESAANIVSISVFTSLLTTLVLKWFC